MSVGGKLGSSQGPLSSWAYLEHLPWEVTRRHPYQMTEPPQLAPFNAKKQRLYSKSLMDDCTSHLIPRKDHDPHLWSWRIFQIHKAHVDLLGKFPSPSWDLCVSEKLVIFFTTWTESTLFLFNPRFDYWPHPPFQHLRVNFAMEAE